MAEEGFVLPELELHVVVSHCIIACGCLCHPHAFPAVASYALVTLPSLQACLAHHGLMLHKLFSRWHLVTVLFLLFLVLF